MASKPRYTPRDKGLLKGCFRRVFSRSELRKQALESTRIQHSDPDRPRVTKWSWCTDCGEIIPTYTVDIDHREPLVPLHKSLDEMSLDELAERMWCELDNLKPVCKDCHKAKSTAENKIRRELKKGKKK